MRGGKRGRGGRATAGAGTARAGTNGRRAVRGHAHSVGARRTWPWTVCGREVGCGGARRRGGAWIGAGPCGREDPLPDASAHCPSMLLLRRPGAACGGCAVGGGGSVRVGIAGLRASEAPPTAGAAIAAPPRCAGVVGAVVGATPPSPSSRLLASAASGMIACVCVCVRWASKRCVRDLALQCVGLCTWASRVLHATLHHAVARERAHGWVAAAAAVVAGAGQARSPIKLVWQTDCRGCGGSEQAAHAQPHAAKQCEANRTLRARGWRAVCVLGAFFFFHKQESVHNKMDNYNTNVKIIIKNINTDL